MGDQLANNPEALRLFFTEDIYLVQQGEEQAFTSPLEASNQVEVAHPSSELQKDAKATVEIPVMKPLAVQNDVVEAQTSMQEPASAYESPAAQSGIENVAPLSSAQA